MPLKSKKENYLRIIAILDSGFCTFTLKLPVINMLGVTNYKNYNITNKL